VPSPNAARAPLSSAVRRLRLGSAVLKDVTGLDRVIYRTDPAYPAYNGVVPIELVLSSATYELKARATLGPGEHDLEQLLAIAAKAVGDASYHLWGVGNYRPGGPLLSMTLSGDNLGHFRVKVVMVEGDLGFSDQFQTDQSCVAAFITQVRQLAAARDA
jgi:hypothetical protein